MIWDAINNFLSSVSFKRKIPDKDCRASFNNGSGSVVINLFEFGPASHPVSTGDSSGSCVHQVGIGARENKKPRFFKLFPAIFSACSLFQNGLLNCKINFITPPKPACCADYRFSGISGTNEMAPFILDASFSNPSG